MSDPLRLQPCCSHTKANASALPAAVVAGRQSNAAHTARARQRRNVRLAVALLRGGSPGGCLVIMLDCSVGVLLPGRGTLLPLWQGSEVHKVAVLGLLSAGAEDVGLGVAGGEVAAVARMLGALRGGAGQGNTLVSRAEAIAPLAQP